MTNRKRIKETVCICLYVFVHCTRTTTVEEVNKCNKFIYSIFCFYYCNYLLLLLLMMMVSFCVFLNANTKCPLFLSTINNHFIIFICNPKTKSTYVSPCFIYFHLRFFFAKQFFILIHKLQTEQWYFNGKHTEER